MVLQLAVEDVEGVPPLQQIPQAEVMAEEFARALVQAWGPPTLEWCQNEALCVLCVQQGEACVFDVPSVGSQHDTSICLPCHMSHEKCLILLKWQVVCVAAEQGWDKDWVQSQLGKARKAWVSGEGSAGQSAGQVGPLWGGWREGASSAADCGKRRASLPLGAGPSKRPWGHELMAGSSGVLRLLSYPKCSLGMGIKFSRAPAFDHGGLPLQASGGANSGINGTGERASMGEGGSRRGMSGEGGVGVGAEHLSASGTRWEAWSMEEAEEWEMAPEGGLLRAELEVVRQREDWLANEAASGHVGILCWVQEHWVLLDGASAAFVLIQDGLVQMPMGQPLELQQGMVRVGRLLAGHWWCNAVAPGSWWEVVADAGEALLGLTEVLAVVWAQMEIDLAVGTAGVLGKE
ncbi:hypothetical protein E4T56_gene12115 [Termitomyces sp. T112]|nr:hypothetical protein E4T56_gene12115 [Termitomyces sp. T112]